MHTTRTCRKEKVQRRRSEIWKKKMNEWRTKQLKLKPRKQMRQKPPKMSLKWGAKGGEILHNWKIHPNAIAFCTQKMHEPKRAICVECISKKANKNRKKVPKKKMVCNFCIMKNAAGKTHTLTHTHTCAVYNETHGMHGHWKLSCKPSWTAIQTQKYILKLKCNGLTQCKQPKGCKHRHSHALTLPVASRTPLRLEYKECIFVHLEDTLCFGWNRKKRRSGSTAVGLKGPDAQTLRLD